MAITEEKKNLLSGWVSNQPSVLSHGWSYRELERRRSSLLKALKSDCRKAERNDVKSAEATFDQILREGEKVSHELKRSL